MKDLKHLIWFEDLLQQANNELVQRAAAEGQLALGYNCYYIPEVLLNLPGCFSSRLRAPNSGTAEIASYYMTNRNCPYVRCILERAIEGGFNYLNALFGAEGCAAMERMEEHFTLLKPVKNDRFITTIIDPPMKGDRTSLDYYKAQLKAAIDRRIPASSSLEDLLARLQREGYEIKRGKYISARAPDQERFTRLKTLGADYKRKKPLSPALPEAPVPPDSPSSAAGRSACSLTFRTISRPSRAPDTSGGRPLRI